jgi:hypothetical protein
MEGEGPDCPSKAWVRASRRRRLGFARRPLPAEAMGEIGWEGWRRPDEGRNAPSPSG